jgi:hypothetical protein
MSERDALAAKHFPDAWARVATAFGKSSARQKLRKAGEQAEKVELLAACGSHCSNCGAYDTRPIPGMKQSGFCGMDSDFHGYAFVKPNNLCHRWSSRQPAPPVEG